MLMLREIRRILSVVCVLNLKEIWGIFSGVAEFIEVRRAITTAATDRNCEVYKITIIYHFSFYFSQNLKSVERIKCIFHIKNFRLPPIFRLWVVENLPSSYILQCVYHTCSVHKKAMTVVQTAVVFVRVEGIPLDKVTAGFTSSLLQHQWQ